MIMCLSEKRQIQNPMPLPGTIYGSKKRPQVDRMESDILLVRTAVR